MHMCKRNKWKTNDVNRIADNIMYSSLNIKRHNGKAFSFKVKLNTISDKIHSVFVTIGRHS